MHASSPMRQTPFSRRRQQFLLDPNIKDRSRSLQLIPGQRSKLVATGLVAWILPILIISSFCALMQYDKAVLGKQGDDL